LAEGGPDRGGAEVQYEALVELVKGRRTIRAMKPDPLPDGTVDRLVEVARWAPTGFNMQPAEFVVVRDAELRREIKRIVDDWVEHDFFALEATREEWQGPPWTAETHGRPECPAAPVYILVTGDTRRRVGLPMNVRLERHKGDSIFESSLSNAFVYLWLAAHTLCPPSRAPRSRGWSGTCSVCRNSSTSSRCWPWDTALWKKGRRRNSRDAWKRWFTTIGSARLSSGVRRSFAGR